MDKISFLLVFLLLIKTEKTLSIECFQSCSKEYCRIAGGEPLPTWQMNHQECRGYCIAWRAGPYYEYYFCGTPEQKDLCERRNKDFRMICISCSTNYCNTELILTRKQNNRIQCYFGTTYCFEHYCFGAGFCPPSSRGCIIYIENGGYIERGCVDYNRCAAKNMRPPLCYYCETDFCNTEDALNNEDKDHKSLDLAKSINCYHFSSVWKRSDLFTKAPTQLCDGFCIAKADGRHRYYYCGTADDKDQCEHYNNKVGVCVFCQTSHCNTESILEEAVKKRIQCYDYCTGENCESAFPSSKFRLCPPGEKGCAAMKKVNVQGTSYGCAVTNEWWPNDWVVDFILCNTTLCNTKAAFIEGQISKQKTYPSCFHYCTYPYDLIPEPLSRRCNGKKSNKIGDLVACPAKDNIGCLMLKYGDLEIYDCASNSDSTECKSITNKGQGICDICTKHLCNTADKLKERAKSLRPKGVTACYYYDLIKNSTKIQTRLCPDIHRTDYKCMSVEWMEEDGNVKLLKNCANATTQAVYQQKCKMLTNKECYFCDKDLCNLNHTTLTTTTTTTSTTITAITTSTAVTTSTTSRMCSKDDDTTDTEIPEQDPLERRGNGNDSCIRPNMVVVFLALLLSVNLLNIFCN